MRADVQIAAAKNRRRIDEAEFTDKVCKSNPITVCRIRYEN